MDREIDLNLASGGRQPSDYESEQLIARRTRRANALRSPCLTEALMPHHESPTSRRDFLARTGGAL